MDPAAIILYQHAAPVGFAAFPQCPPISTTRRNSSTRSPTRSLPRPSVEEEPPLWKSPRIAKLGDNSSDVFLLAARYARTPRRRDSGEVPSPVKGAARVCFFFFLPSSPGSSIPPGPDFFIRTIFGKIVSRSRSAVDYPKKFPPDHPETAGLAAWRVADEDPGFLSLSGIPRSFMRGIIVGNIDIAARWRRFNRKSDYTVNEPRLNAEEFSRTFMRHTKTSTRGIVE